MPLQLTISAGGSEADFAFQLDALGNVAAITNSSGTAVAQYSYDPYGNIISTTGQNVTVGGASIDIKHANPLRYRGYYLDEETGFYYLPARYYDPETMRFISADPAPASAANPTTMNRYAYCMGDPVSFDDPTGAVTDVEYEAWDYYYYYNDHEYENAPADRHLTARASTRALRAKPAALRTGVTLDLWRERLRARQAILDEQRVIANDLADDAAMYAESLQFIAASAGATAIIVGTMGAGTPVVVAGVTTVGLTSVGVTAAASTVRYAAYDPNYTGKDYGGDLTMCAIDVVSFGIAGSIKGAGAVEYMSAPASLVYDAHATYDYEQTSGVSMWW